MIMNSYSFSGHPIILDRNKLILSFLSIWETAKLRNAKETRVQLKNLLPGIVTGTYDIQSHLLTRTSKKSSAAYTERNITYSGPLLTGVTGKDSGTNLTAAFSHDGNGNTTAGRT